MENRSAKVASLIDDYTTITSGSCRHCCQEPTSTCLWCLKHLINVGREGDSVV
ncbi:hypothetical protein AGABI2DRAFT_136591 [Agaricus bisporus var. bisporus H97]|uniref:hypothetical protein n=1 Tax=Agaricus bisporus var. bisporus (strain H97 / ATCC MYA-4626 / FGSC 10389) TaxID=936046 RepID=UPI00029F61D8|nr:hypothetical protein AGABI2DRAFT_136591 [Agaricus bisporus var. bisporus H97]EKV46334.1 hypothetical protein AGABI2DRAFT_136591 [Agaricus bisporus var. bisporus H97]